MLTLYPAASSSSATVDPHDPEQLAEPLRTAVKTLIADSHGRVYLTSGRRSTAMQIVLRRQHCGPSHADIYDKPASQCRPPTAKPGESKHERGEAADLGGDLAYVESRASELGIAQTVAGERWHFEAVGGSSTSTSTSTSTGSASWSPASGGGGLSVLTSGGTWIRVAEVLGGSALVVAGIMMFAGRRVNLAKLGALVADPPAAVANVALT